MNSFEFPREINEDLILFAESKSNKLEVFDQRKRARIYLESHGNFNQLLQLVFEVKSEIAKEFIIKRIWHVCMHRLADFDVTIIEELYIKLFEEIPFSEAYSSPKYIDDIFDSQNRFMMYYYKAYDFFFDIENEFSLFGRSKEFIYHFSNKLCGQLELCRDPHYHQFKEYYIFLSQNEIIYNIMKKLLIFREEEKFKSRNRNEENSKYFDRFGKLVGLFFDKIDFPIIDDFINKIKFKTIEECSNYQIPFVSLGFFINYFQDVIQTSKSHEDTLARDTNIYNFMKKYHVFEVLDQYLDRNSNKYIADGIVSMFGSVIPIPNESPLCEYSHDIIRIFVKSITFVGSIQRCFLSKFHKFFTDFTDEEIVMLKISLMNNLLNSIKNKSVSDLCDILRLVFYKKSEFFLIDVNELIQRLFTSNPNIITYLLSLQKVESDINYEAIITSLRLFSDLLLLSSDISEDVLKLYLVLLLHLPDDYVSSLNIQIYLQFYNYLKEQVLQGNTIFHHFLYEFVKKFCLILCEYLHLEQEIKNLLFSFNRSLVKVATYLINYLNSLVKKILNKQKFNFNKGHRSMSEDNSCISDYMQFIEEKWKREEQLVNKINFDNLKINEFSERFCDLLFSKENLNIDEIQAALVFFEEIKNPPSQVSLQSFMNWMSLISNDLIYQIKLVRILTRWFGFTIYPEYSTIIKKIHENEIPLIRKSATSREYLRLLKIVAKYTRKSIFKLENDNEIYINTAAILWKSIKPITDRKFDFHKRKTPWKMIRYVSMYLIDTLTRSFNKVYFQEIEKILQLAYTHDILQKFKEEEDIENKLFSLLMAHLDENKDNVVEWVYYISSHISSTQYHEIEAPLIFLYRINEEIPGIINESNIEVMMPRNYHSMNYSSTEEIEKNKNLLLDFFSCADGEIEDKLCDLVKKVYPYRNGSHR